MSKSASMGRSPPVAERRMSRSASPRPRNPLPRHGSVAITAQRDATDPFPLPNCEACIAGFAPESLRGRRAVDYQRPIETGARLEYSDWPELRLEVAQKERGHCHIAMLPPGVTLSEYRLFENERGLGPAQALHDDIRQHGGGRYSLWERSVYFSSSDNSDARYNGRSYALKRVPADD